MGDLDASQAFWAKITTCVGVAPVADVKRSLRMTKLQQYQKLGATVSLYSVKETLSMAFDDAVQGSGEVSDRRPTVVGGTGQKKMSSLVAWSLVSRPLPGPLRHPLRYPLPRLLPHPSLPNGVPASLVLSGLFRCLLSLGKFRKLASARREALRIDNKTVVSR